MRGRIVQVGLLLITFLAFTGLEVRAQSAANGAAAIQSQQQNTGGQGEASKAPVPWDPTDWSGGHAAAFETFITAVGQMDRKQDPRGFHLFEPDNMEGFWTRINKGDILLPDQDWQVVYAESLICFHKEELLDHEEMARVPWGSPLSPETVSIRDDFAAQHLQLYRDAVVEMKQAIDPQSFARLDAYVFHAYHGDAKIHHAAPHRDSGKTSLKN
jgi:hypothetical protein